MVIKVKKLFIILALLLIATPIYAQTINLQRAKVLEVVKEEKSVLFDEVEKNVEVLVQTLDGECITFKLILPRDI